MVSLSEPEIMHSIFWMLVIIASLLWRLGDKVAEAKEDLVRELQFMARDPNSPPPDRLVKGR